FDFIFSSRVSHFASDVAADVVSLADIRWNESLNISALCRARRNTLFFAVEFDSGSAVPTDFRRRGAVAVHIDHVVSFALVRRTCCALRSKASTCRWARYYSRWLFAFPAAGNWRQLLDKFFSAGGCAGPRHGNHGSAADHDRYELDQAEPRWDRIGSEQRRRAHGESDRNRSPWRRNASRVRNQSGSQIEHCEFAGVSRTIAANSIDQARGHRYSERSEPRNTTTDPSRNRRIVCLWVPLDHGDWRCTRRCKRSHRAVLDWSNATCTDRQEELMPSRRRNSP